jgi:hypothetical protein
MGGENGYTTSFSFIACTVNFPVSATLGYSPKVQPAVIVSPTSGLRRQKWRRGYFTVVQTGRPPDRSQDRFEHPDESEGTVEPSSRRLIPGAGVY